MFKEKMKALISKGSGEENNGNNKKKIENLVVFILILIITVIIINFQNTYLVKFHKYHFH